MSRVLFFLITVLCCQLGIAQSGTYKSTSLSGKKIKTVNIRELPPAFNTRILHLEAPNPDGNSIRNHLQHLKKKTRERFPIKTGYRNPNAGGGLDPIINWGTGTFHTLPNGVKQEIFGGLPNDNTMAISNDGILLLGMNSFVYAYDTKTDSATLPNSKIFLQSFYGGINNRYFDPKIIYDPGADRFILVFLKNSVPATSEIIIAFSSSNDPVDPWHVYALPGNPLNNDRWTDYPAISISENELFITGNLIVPNVSWQVGFDGSLIWQIEKQHGYDGAVSINSKLHHDIRYNGKYVRNLHTVRGSEGINEENYFLSNRNFAISNDTFFVLKLDGELSDPQQNLIVKMGKTDMHYGMPPNGRQLDHDFNDSTSGLQTNDARVLGGYLHKGNIQFVGNSVVQGNGLAGFYHGFISNLDENPVITTKIIGDGTMDLGYPNIAFSGNELCDNESMIGFDYTSTVDFAGIGVIYHNNDGTYSDLIRLKDGDGYVDRLGGPYERWGDYFGIQRKFNQPGKVYTTGFYGTLIKKNSAWINEITSPDTNQLALLVEMAGQGVSCTGELTAKPSGGLPPYTYNWSSQPNNNSENLTGVCFNDSILLNVTDARGCIISETIVWDQREIPENATVYPNPFSNEISIQFTLEQDGEVTANIYDIQGRIVHRLIEQNAKKGLNELLFSLEPLLIGTYIVKVLSADTAIVTEKIVKY